MPLICGAQSSPSILSLQGAQENRVTLSGHDFGQRCQACEVIADYGHGLKYSVQIESWEETRIQVRIRDLNKGLRVQVQVVAEKGGSNSRHYTIRPVIRPGRSIARMIPAGTVKDLLVFARSSSRSVGDKGVDSYQVGNSPPACRHRALIFDHAQLLQQGRYGLARILSRPEPGCLQCSPIKIKWHQEPTGDIAYQLHVYRREIWGICADRLR